MPKIIESKLIENFKDNEIVSREELLDFFRYFEPHLNAATFGWRIHDLKNKNIIKPIRRGYYSISHKPKYQPEISNQTLKLAKFITTRFSEVKHCIWETKWLNEFSKHQGSKQLILIEIEKDLLETLYYQLKDAFAFDIYLNPAQRVIDLYLSESHQPIVIKKLITRSPLEKQAEKRVKVYIPTLEKVLVDLFTDDKIFYFYQGVELVFIYESVIKSYPINYTKLLSYAKRREKEQEIKRFMFRNFDYLVKNIIK